jgi:hypothetical protein
MTDSQQTCGQAIRAAEGESPTPVPTIQEIGYRRGQEIWSVRVTLKYRALSIRLADEYVWFWIGEHNTYDAVIA